VELSRQQFFADIGDDPTDLEFPGNTAGGYGRSVKKRYRLQIQDKQTGPFIDSGTRCHARR
jgi:hypothetical protein